MFVLLSSPGDESNPPETMEPHSTIAQPHPHLTPPLPLCLDGFAPETHTQQHDTQSRNGRLTGQPDGDGECPFAPL